MNKEDEALLAEYGFIVECESPFEIALEDDPFGSRATGQAAQMLLEAIREAEGVDADG